MKDRIINELAGCFGIVVVSGVVILMIAVIWCAISQIVAWIRWLT
jgi:hypothetical protein